MTGSTKLDRETLRPLAWRGAKSFDAGVAEAFGRVVRTVRLDSGISQEALAYMAKVERSYFGRIERGESQPTLHVVLKLAAAVGVKASALIAAVEDELSEGASSAAP